MLPRSLLLCFLLLLCSLTPSHGAADAPVAYMEVTRSLRTDYQLPTCSLAVFKLKLNATFSSAAAYGYYTAPADCGPPWAAVVAELSASATGYQDKRIAALWVGGVEILRSSTVRSAGHGAVWKVRKDVTKYSSMLSSSNSTIISVVFKDAIKGSVAAEILHSNFQGTLHANVSLLFYGGTNGGGENGFRTRKLGFLGEADENESREFGVSQVESAESERELGFPGKTVILEREGEKKVETMENLRLPSQGGLKSSHFYRAPADLIIPIAGNDANGAEFWFEIHNASDVQSKEIKIPANTYQAVLEIYASAHGRDEFWYLNPPTPPKTRQQEGNLTAAPVKDTFREVFASIDSRYAGSFVPFPTVYSGGIDPGFWDPVVAITAFDLPSYELVLTPFLGILLDGKSHSISLGVSDSTSFWLVDANLHLWLDEKSPQVTAQLVRYKAPADARISRRYRFGENSEFEVKAKRKVKFAGWVDSSYGNLTTRIEQEQEFTNQMQMKGNERYKQVQQKSKTKTEIMVETAYRRLVLAKATFEAEYPLELKSETQKRDNIAYLLRTIFSHERNEQSSVLWPYEKFFSSLKNRQISENRTLVRGPEILSTMANTKQQYSYRDNGGCYIRSLVAGQGLLLKDRLTTTCMRAE